MKPKRRRGLHPSAALLATNCFMLVRHLVNSWLRQAAQEKLQETVSEFAHELRTEPSGQTEKPPHEGPEGEPPSPCAAAMIFALGVESGGTVDRLDEMSRRRFRHRVEYDGWLDGRRVAAVDSGVGIESARRATERVIARHHPAWIVSAGFAAGLCDDVRKGQVLMADQIVDLHGREFDVGLKMDPDTIAATRGLHVGRLLTVDQIVRAADERRALGEKHAALACDLETSGVAQACLEGKTRFLAVRVITETLDEELPPEIESLVAQKTKAAKLGAAAGAIFHRPSSVKEMWRLKEETIKASDRLAKFLQGVLMQLPGA